MKRKVMLLLVGLLALCSVGCGDKNQPRPLPLTRALDLTSHKIGKVDLVVKDEARAEKVKSIYEDIERLLLERKIFQAEQRVKGFAAMGEHMKESEEALRKAFASLREGRAALYEKYVNLQLELRKHLTAEEFKKLNAVR